MKIISLLLFNLICGNLYCQLEIDWSKVYGGSSYEFGEAILQVPDGGFIITGTTYSADGDLPMKYGGGDIILLKVNDKGESEWQKSYGSPYKDNASDIALSDDGGYVTAGIVYGNGGDVSVYNGTGDIWVFKVSSSGEIIWERTLGGTGWEPECSIIKALDGGYIIAGTTNSDDGDITEHKGYYDFWVVKLSEVGEIMWSKTYGGSDDDKLKDINYSSDGGYILAGNTNSTDGDVQSNKNGMGGEIWVLNLSLDGSIKWESTFGFPDYDFCSAIISTSDNGYAIASGADIQQLSADNDYRLTKLDLNGVVEWKVTYGSDKPDNPSSIFQTEDGGFLLGGVSYPSFNAGAWFLKLDHSGSYSNSDIFGGSETDSSSDLIATQDNQYIFLGSSKSNDGDVGLNHGETDVWIVKLKETSMSSIEEDSNMSLKLYPNPSDNVITIEFAQSYQINGELQIKDMLGKIVQSTYLNSNRQAIDISHLKPGTYLASYSDGHHYLYKKLVKIK